MSSVLTSGLLQPRAVVYSYGDTVLLCVNILLKDIAAADRHLGCFQFLAIIKNAAVNIVSVFGEHTYILILSTYLVN